MKQVSLTYAAFEYTGTPRTDELHHCVVEDELSTLRLLEDYSNMNRDPVTWQD